MGLGLNVHLWPTLYLLLVGLQHIFDSSLDNKVKVYRQVCSQTQMLMSGAAKWHFCFQTEQRLVYLLISRDWLSS